MKRPGHINWQGIRMYSVKRMEELKRYKVARRHFLRLHKTCEVCNGNKSRDIHHRRGRGPFYLDETTWSAVCRECHDRIHNNPQWATENGWLESRLQKV